MSLLKTAKRKAIDEAKRTAKDVSGEILEIPKSVPKQVTGESEEKRKKETTSGLPKLPSLKGFDVGEDVKKLPQDVSGQIIGAKTQPETVPSAPPKPSSPIVETMTQHFSGPKDEGELETVEGSKDIEMKMQKLRDLRKKQEKEWKEQQEAVMNQPPSATKPGEPIAPPASPKKGPKGGGPKKAQIETRKSKH